MCEVMGNIIYADYYMTKWLDPAMVAKLYKRAHFTEEQIAEVAIPNVLRYISLAAPMVGAVAFMFLIYHCHKTATAAYQKKVDSSEIPWCLNSREDMVMIIIAVPAIFIIMSIRSLSRIWMVMRGFNFGEAAAQDIALYKENFELAAVCQYYTVFVFTQLCLSFLTEVKATEDMKIAIKWVGFQGAYAWCLIGSLHSVVLFGLADEAARNFDSEMLTKIMDAERTIGLVASVFSVLCTYNMAIMCKLNYVNSTLNGATMKFNGTKMMLLLGPNQLKILKAIVAMPNPQWPILQSIQGLVSSDDRAMLLHASLMCFEAFIVVALNFKAWMVDGLADDEKVKSLNSIEQPLLES